MGDDQSLADRIDYVELLREIDFGDAFEGTALGDLLDNESADGDGVGETIGARVGELLGGLVGGALGRTVGTSLLHRLLDVGGDDGGQ